MKKLIIAAALLSTFNAFAADDTHTPVSESGFTVNVMGGYDTNSSSALALELGYNNFLMGVQGYNDIDNFQNLYNKVHPNDPSTFAVVDAAFKQKDWALYGGYRFDNGISLKAGATFTSLDATLAMRGAINGKPVSGSGAGDINTTRPFVGIGYDIDNNWNVSLNYTHSAEKTLSATLDDEDKSIVSNSYKFDSHTSLMVGYRF